jgi:hypothetical protein
MRKFEKLFVILPVLLFVGCFSVNPNLTPEGARVKIAKNKPKGCESLGNFTSPGIDVDKVGKKTAMNIIRNIVAEEGGDTVRLKDMVRYDVKYKEQKSYIYEGYMYRCK